MHSLMDQLISGPMRLSDKLLARLYTYSRTDKPGHFHALFLHSHFIIDDIVALATIRTFFNVLSLPSRKEVPGLQTRLDSHRTSNEPFIDTSRLDWLGRTLHAPIPESVDRSARRSRARETSSNVGPSIQPCCERV